MRCATFAMLSLLLATVLGNAQTIERCAAEQRSAKIAFDLYLDIFEMGQADNPELVPRAIIFGDLSALAERCRRSQQEAAKKAWPESVAQAPK